MSLLAEIEAQQSSRGGTCGVSLLRLSDADRADFDGAIANAAIQATAIARALKARGHTIGEDAIQRHRRKACSCPH